MNRYSFLVLLGLFCLLSVTAAGQSRLQGHVTDAVTGEPVVGAIVRTKGAFASTGRDGSFSLLLKNEADSVTFRCMGYETLTVSVSDDVADVRLSQKVTRLNDIIVEAPDIYARGDTLVFNVSRYANAKDNAIIDVIKRLPGIKVDKDGTIKYQGKPINKFYIDGNDFIGGQYGLAVNNLSHEDVKSVEVMENHQPVKALEGIEFPEEAGINLTLKEDARSRWVGVVKAAAGVQPLLYDGSLFTMRLASKIQNMFTLKADNTGWNPVNEICDHDFDMMFSSDYMPSLWREYISADIISAPLSELRTRDNLSLLANAITAWKSGDTSMRLKLDYMGDRLDYNSGVTTDYFSAQIPVFIQNNVQHMQSHDVSGQFYSETNKRGYYLKDKLTLSGRWENTNSVITGSYDLAQCVVRKKLSAVNDLKLVKRNDKKLFTLTSRNAVEHRPDRLLIAGDGDVMQTIGITDFRTTTETRFGKLTRFWKYYLTAGIDVNYHRMNSSLAGFGSFDNCGVHDVFLSNLYVTPQIDYDRSGWRMSLNVPLKWYHYAVAGQHDYINVFPRFNVKRQIGAKTELSGTITYRLVSPQPYLYIDIPVMADYRNMFIAENYDKYTQDITASLSLGYRNPLKSLFVNVSASYSHQRSPNMSNRIFIDDFIISTFADRLSHSDTWNMKGGISKGIGHSKMVAGFDTELSLASASSMRDYAVIPFQQVTAAIKPYIKGSILSWLSVNYEAEYGFSKLTIGGDINTYHTFHQVLFATIIPNDIVQFTAGAEHFFTRFPEGNLANLVLLDASAVWRLNGKVRLSLTANNLLNKRNYEYVTYGTLSCSEHTFNIRQRSILASIQYRF
ncbi:MAG: carboxypeptidase-like regulatory domain-containing protein [Paramuribaculum sp.]|nr:carboxypeptidase-like regulatory domain-containing protein [Paramuribaculum sp.]